MIYGRYHFDCRRIGEAAAKHFLKRSWNLIVTLLRFYIGYFGAGFLIISLPAICSMEKINQISVVKAAATGVVAVFFLISMQALRRHCFIVMVGVAGGGYLGLHISRRLDLRFMRGTGGLYRLGHGCLFFVPAELK